MTCGDDDPFKNFKGFLRWHKKTWIFMGVFWKSWKMLGGKESEKVMVTLGFTSPEMDSFKVVEGVIPSHICRNHFNQAQTRKKSCASQLYDVDFIALTFGFCLGPVEVSIFEVTRLY